MTRLFLASALAFALPAAAPAADAAPPLRVGIVSDTHVKGDANKDLAFCRKAFETFRDAHVDAVVVPGDLVDDGQVEQLREFAAVWREVFPGDALPDGTHVEKFFIYGNHDSSSLAQGIAQRNLRNAARLWGEDAAKDHLMAYHEGEMWEEVFGEPWAPVYAKTIKGHVFVGCHWGHETETAAWLAANADRLGLRGSKPFFYVQHPHPGGTVQSHNGEFAWGNDGGAATRALAGFPNAVALSGHSHYPLSDEQSIWQGGFTSVNCSSSAYLGRRDGRDNGEWENHGRKGRKVGPVPVAARFWHGRHAMLLDVHPDRFVFRRIDLLHGLPLGTDWTCPVPACVDDASRPYAFAASSRVGVPRFPADAASRIGVSMREGKDRAGKEGPIVAVSFPVALSDGPDGRVFEYEVTAENVGYGIVRVAEQKRVLTARIDDAWELEKAAPDARAECLFRLDELPQEIPVRFRIAPLNSFGAAGEAIVSDAVRLPLD